MRKEELDEIVRDLDNKIERLKLSKALIEAKIDVLRELKLEMQIMKVEQ